MSDSSTQVEAGAAAGGGVASPRADAAGVPGPRPAAAGVRGNGNGRSGGSAAVEARVREMADVEGASSPTFDMRAKIGLALTAALFAGTWWHAMGEMWHRWFPAWKRTTYGITERLTGGDSYYTHGPLVPIVAVVIAWLIYRRVGVPVKRTRWSNRLGAVLLGMSIFVQVMGARADVNFVMGFAMIGVLGALVVLWGGFPLARAYWLPVAFLLFMVPLPMSMIADINFELKRIAGGAALWLTNNIFGIFATMDGSTVYLLPDSVAPGQSVDPIQLTVENTCSGLRSLISLVCFASLFALICRVKGWWRFMMLVLALPVAVLTNVIRITILNVAAFHIGPDVSSPGGWVHDTTGLAVFALALGILFGVESLIIWVGKKVKRDWSDPRIMGYLDELPRRKTQPLAALRPAPLLGLAFIAGVSTMWALEDVKHNHGQVAAQAVGSELLLGGVKYVGQDLEMDKQTRDILQTDDYLRRQFLPAAIAGGGPAVGKALEEAVELTIVFSANNRKGTHPPEVCLEGGGGRITSKQVHEVSFVRGGASQGRESAGLGGGGRTIEMRELVTEHPMARTKTLHLYTYKCGDAYTPNFFTQQATIFFNGLVMRNTAGALIRVDVPIVNDDEQTARAEALEAAKAFMAQIDQGLP